MIVALRNTIIIRNKDKTTCTFNVTNTIVQIAASN